MDLAEALAHVRANPQAVLATLRGDGAPQLSPVLAAVDGEGRVVVSSRETAYKVRNLRRDPRAWLCVLTEQFFGAWAQVEGEVEIVSLPEAMEPLVEYYRTVAGEHPDWEQYRQAMRDERRCLIRVTVTRAGPSASG